jgi:hypothetical protein
MRMLRLPDLREEIARCERHGKMHDACGVHYLGLTGPPMKYGRRGSDWMKLSTGDRVREREDGRHEGRVEAILQGYEAKVKWDNGMMPLRDLERVRE